MALAGEPLFRIVRPNGRRLNTRIKHALQKYVRTLRDFLLNHKYPKKLYALGHDAPHIPHSQHSARTNSLDRVKTEGMRHAEKTCRKLRMGRVPFTPEVDKAYKTKQLWQQVVRVKEKKKKSLRDINRLKVELEIISPLAKTLRQAKEELEQAEKHYALE